MRGRQLQDAFGEDGIRRGVTAVQIPFQMPAVKVVIVEDHVMFREVLRKICEKELKLAVVGESGDGQAAPALVEQTQPHLVLLDLHLPNLDGFGVAEQVRKVAPDARILVLSSHCDEFTVFRAERVRVHGFVDKNTNSIATLKEAIGMVAGGGVWFSEPFQRIKASRLKDPLSFDKILTKRERAIVTLIGEPLNDEQIAERLGISIETVEKHRFNVLKKLDLSNRTEIVRYAREHGFTLKAPKSGEGAMLP